MNKPIIKKIEFSKEIQEEIDKIKRGEPIPKTKIVGNKLGYTYEITTNKRFSYEVARKKLVALYGGACTFCDNWPDYKVRYDVGDERQGAWLVQRYCSTCYDKWKDRLRI